MDSYQNALSTYIEATNTHDFQEVKKSLAADVIYWFSDKTCTTHAEIGAYFEEAWRSIKDEAYSATDVRWISTDEKTAVCLYTFHYQGYQNGDFIQGSGRATNVFVREKSGLWKLKHEHLSSL